MASACDQQKIAILETLLEGTNSTLKVGLKRAGAERFECMDALARFSEHTKCGPSLRWSLFLLEERGKVALFCTSQAAIVSAETVQTAPSVVNFFPGPVTSAA
jgi:hypothetical protein